MSTIVHSHEPLLSLICRKVNKDLYKIDLGPAPVYVHTGCMNQFTYKTACARMNLWKYFELLCQIDI